MMRISAFCGSTAAVLENDLLRVVVLPKNGGKLASIYHKGKTFELLFQNPKQRFESAYSGASFEQFEACGFDDAFPTVDACTVEIGGECVSYPDHGEIWSAKFAIHSMREDSVQLCYHSPLLGYTYEKTVTLRENRIEYSIRIVNDSEKEFPCLWVMHCLVNHRHDMRLILPAGERETVYFGAGMEKFYLKQPVTEGRCGYEYPSDGIRAMFVYDREKLPYLGFWQTLGGYRGDWNCALEPATGYYDSIPVAQKNGACPILKPSELLELSISIELEEI